MRRLALFRRAPDKLASKRRPPRRSAKPGRRLARILIVAVTAAAVYGAGDRAWRAGWVSQAAAIAEGWAIAASSGLGLRVRQVLLEGRRHTPRPDIVSAIDISRGDPLLGIDLDRLRARVESIPWVRAASVQRQWPKTVHVVIEERKPIAIWQRDRRLSLVDRYGATIATGDLQPFADLLVVVGRGAPKQASKLLEVLNTRPLLRERVLAAVRVGSRRWDIRFKNGVDVRLPEHDAPAAWARLADLDRRHGLLSTEIEVIDMRLPDRLIVRTRSAPVHARRGRGERT